MKIKLWKPEVHRIIKTIANDPQGWEELINLYEPNHRPKKRDERYEKFEKLGLNKKWEIDKNTFSASWYGLDQMMINIMTPEFKKEGVPENKNKLEYLENLWLFSTIDADKKILLDVEEEKKWEEIRKADFNSKVESIISGLFFKLSPFILIFLLLQYCTSYTPYNHPACSTLGLKSNWNNTKCY